MNFIELTSFIRDRQGYSDEPLFDRQLWPLFLTNRQAIGSVFLFRHELSTVPAEFFGDYELISHNIVAVGPLGRLSSEKLEALEYLSFFGGHLSVLYQTRNEDSFVPQLCRLYPQPGRLSNDAIDTLGLEDSARFELGAFVGTLSDDMLLVSFAHDADPLYIFGEKLTLSGLLEVASLAE